MKGTRPQNLPAASKQKSEANRVCAQPDCETRLSRYNASDHCWQHADATFPTFRGKRLSDPGHT